MINIIIYSKNDKKIGYEISGHANYDVAGSDIVCSAVSFLAINTANAIESFCKDEFEVLMEEDGYLKLIITINISKDALLLIDTFSLGVEHLARQYGKKYINITFEEV